MLDDSPSGAAHRKLRSYGSALLALVCLLALSAQTAIIQRTITVDGNFDDWRLGPGGSGPDITTNTGQFSTDPLGASTSCSNPVLATEDRDCIVQSTGRDLERFAFTFDNSNLYMFVERYASTSNATLWWFYIDLDADGRLEAGEKVLNVSWQGNNGNTIRTLYSYVPQNAAVGDPLVSPVTGRADGWDMPGTVTAGNQLDPNNDPLPGGATSGPQAGVEMETRIAWNVLKPGATGPFSVGFHISSSNSTNIPNQIDDNMDGPTDGEPFLQFADPFVTKTGPAKGVSGFAIPFVITLGNNGPDTALGTRVRDQCSTLSGSRPLVAGESFAYTSHVASAGTSYDPNDDPGDSPDLGAGIWTVPSLASGTTATLTLYCTVTVNTPIDVTNTASIVEFTTADTDTSPASNTASNPTLIEVVPLPSLTVLKSSEVIWDPINGSSLPKRIPGACIRYTVEVFNTGAGPAETLRISDDLPAGTTLYLGDPRNGFLPAQCGGTAAPDGSPVDFDPGNNTTGTSPLTYTFTGLNDGGDDLEFYNTADQETVAAGQTLVAGFDPDIRRLVVRPGGIVRGTADNAGPPTGDPVHALTLVYLVVLQ